jgi:hypothetical protein
MPVREFLQKVSLKIAMRAFGASHRQNENLKGPVIAGHQQNDIGS